MKKGKWQGQGILKEYGAEIAGFVLIAFLFYLQMAQAGITTHDELSNIYRVRRNEFFSMLTWERWGMVVMGALPSWLHALSANQWTYRLFTIAGLLVSSVTFAVFLRKSGGKGMGWLFLFLFFLFAQIQRDHDGLLSFSFSYQLNTAYVFAGLILYSEYLRKRQKKYLVWSGLLYLAGSMAYETFILYGFLFFLLDLFFLKDQHRLTVRNLFRDLVFHASLVTAYFLSYLLVSRLSGVVNVDATLSGNLSLREVLTTTFRLAVGLFPLNYADRSLDAYLSEAFRLSTVNLLRWAVIVLACGCVWKSVVRSERMTGRRYFRISLFCASGMLLPCVLPSLTSKFIQWICYQGVKSFAVSYYSYFFVIAWIGATVVFVYHRIRPEWMKKTFLALCCVMIGFTGECTLISNQKQTEAIHEAQDLYDLYTGLVETDYFAAVENDAQLYVPDYVGIHYQLDTLSEYANAMLGKELTAENDPEELDFDRPVYAVLPDAGNDAACMCRIGEDGLTDEVLVYSLDSLQGRGLTADRRDSGISAAAVNGRMTTAYGANVVTGDLGVSGNAVTFTCGRIVPESVRIYDAGSAYTNRLFSLKGIYENESWGRWAQKDFRITLYGRSLGETVELTAVLVLPTKEDGTVGVSCNNYHATLRAKEGWIAEILQIPMEPGENTIIFYSGSPDLEAPEDPRKLNVQVMELTLQTEKGERIRLSDFEAE